MYFYWLQCDSAHFTVDMSASYQPTNKTPSATTPTDNQPPNKTTTNQQPPNCPPTDHQQPTSITTDHQQPTNITTDHQRPTNITDHQQPTKITTDHPLDQPQNQATNYKENQERKNFQTNDKQTNNNLTDKQPTVNIETNKQSNSLMGLSGQLPNSYSRNHTPIYQPTSTPVSRPTHMNFGNCSPIDTNSASNKLSSSTLAGVLGSDIPEKFKLKLNSTTYEYKIKEEEFTPLFHARKGPTLPAGRWQHVVLYNFDQHNPYCVIQFDKHTVSQATQRTSSSSIFRAKGKCGIKDCPVKCILEMYNIPIMTVTYSCNTILHDTSIMAARHIRVGLRETLYPTFDTGMKPAKFRMDQLLLKKKTNPKILISGNMNNVGCSKSVLQKISSESRSTHVLDKDVITSLSKMKQNMIKDDKPFIQDIGLSPFYVFYWSPDCINIYDNLCKKNVVFIDATGSVTKSTNKRTLYYEVAVHNSSDTSFPVAGMVTDTHHEDQISKFICSFMSAVKRDKGRELPPLRISTDNSLAVINASLRAFNLETLSEYLLRCWNILNGTAAGNNFQKSILHLCLSHNMKSFKRLCKNLPKKNHRHRMYCMSLLSNTTSLAEFEEILSDVTVVYCSQFVSPHFIKHLDRLNEKINSLDTNNLNIQEEEPVDIFENDFIPSLAKSPFYNWALSIIMTEQKQLEILSVQGKEDNYLYCTEFINILKRHYISNMPLWTSAMLGDLHRHGDYGHFTFPIDDFSHRTSGVIEERFTILKVAELFGKTDFRFDEFSARLSEHYEKVHLSGSLSHLKKRKRASKKTTVPCEEWDKKKKRKGPLGYQHSPLVKFPTSKNTSKNNELITTLPVSIPVYSSKTPRASHLVPNRLKNISNTCWLNSLLQSIAPTDIAQDIITAYDRTNVHSDVQQIIDILMFLRNYTDADVPDKLLRFSNLKDGQSLYTRFPLGEQQDSSEFITLWLVHQIPQSLPYVTLNTKRKCLSCGSLSSRISSDPLLFLSLPDRRDFGRGDTIFLQTLVTRLSNSQVVEEYNCESCLTKTQAQEDVNFSGKLPDDIIISLSRFKYKRDCIVKNSLPVVPDLELILNGDRFVLISMVLHHGEYGAAGHYTANIIKYTNDSIYLQKCDDRHTSYEDMPGQWDFETCRSTYLLFYKRRSKHLSHLLLPVLLPHSVSMELFKIKSKKILSEKGIQFMKLLSEKKFEDSAKLLLPIMDTLGLNKNKPIYYIDAISAVLCSDDQRYQQSADIRLFIETIYIVRRTCQSCPNATSIEYCSTSAVFSLDIARSLLNETSTKACHKCDHLSLTTSDVFISSLPKVLYVIFNDSSSSINAMKRDDIDLSHLLHKSYWKVNITYIVYSVILTRDKEVVTYRRLEGSRWHSTNTDECVDTTTVHNACKDSSSVVAVLHQLQCTNAVNFIPALLQNTMPKYQDDLSFTTCPDPKRIKLPITINKHVLDKEHVDIISKDGCFTSTIIDAYMSYLCFVSRKKMFATPCGWMLRTLFEYEDSTNASQFFTAPIHKRNVMQNDFLILPECLQNHWIVFVVDIQQKVIIVCDSMRGTHNVLAKQVLRYLAFQSAIHKGNDILPNQWNLLDYASMDNFPEQTDTHSCGPFIALMAKAIVQRKNFTFDTTLARSTILNDLLSLSV